MPQHLFCDACGFYYTAVRSKIASQNSKSAGLGIGIFDGVYATRLFFNFCLGDIFA